MADLAFLYLQLSPAPSLTAEELAYYAVRLDSLAVTLCGEGLRTHFANWANHKQIDFWVAHPNAAIMSQLRAAWLNVPVAGETVAVVDEED